MIDNIESSIKDGNVLLFEQLLEDIRCEETDFINECYPLLYFISKVLVYNGNLMMYELFINYVKRKSKIMNKDLDDMLNFNWLLMDAFDNDRYDIVSYIISVIIPYINNFGYLLDDILDMNDLFYHAVKTNNYRMLEWLMNSLIQYDLIDYLNLHHYKNEAKKLGHDHIHNYLDKFIKKME